MDQRREQARHHGDVQAGNRHQVRHPGAREQLPLPRVDGILVADRERGQNARIGVAGQCLPVACAQDFAAAFDEICRAQHQAVQARVCARAHIAGRADGTLQQPGLVVEAVGIDAAVRPPQAHGQAPALAGADRRSLLERLATEAVIPGERNAPRQARRVGRVLVHVEIEAHAALERLRQTRHHAGDCQIHTLQLPRQPLGQAPLGPGRGIEKSRRDKQRGQQQCGALIGQAQPPPCKQRGQQDQSPSE